MCVGVWRRSPDSLLIEGGNGFAVFRGSTQVAVTTNRNVINIINIRDINNASRSAGGAANRHQSASQICSFPDAEWHDEITLNAPIFHPIHLQLQSRVKLANDYITCACNFGSDMLLGTRGGYIQVVSWDGHAQMCVDALAWATIASISKSTSKTNLAADTQQETNTHTRHENTHPTTKPAITQVATSVTLGLVAFVFSDGSAGLCDASLLRPTANGAAPQVQPGTGVLLVLGGSIRTGAHATRVAFNSRYRLLAVGLENGDVSVYRVDSQTRRDGQNPIQYSYLRRYSILPWGFTPHDVGSVRCLDWSPDGSVLAVGWSNRGLVIWSTGGTRVACTLPMLSNIQPTTNGTTSPAGINGTKANGANGATNTTTHSSTHLTAAATASHASSDGASISFPSISSLSPPSSPLTPSSAPASELLGHGVSALAWGCGGASLLVSAHCNQNEATHGVGGNHTNTNASNELTAPDINTHGASSYDSKCGCGLVTRLALVRSALGLNSSQNESTSLALLGDDRIVLWSGKRSMSSNDEDAAGEESLESDTDPTGRTHNPPQRKQSDQNAAALTERFLESDGDWEHIQLPSVYLSHAWPVELCALSASGNQIACAGGQGLICYNRLSLDKKWRRFGNVIHESQVRSAGLSWYGEHIVCVASRGHQPAHQINGRTSSWAPPPPAAQQHTNNVHAQEQTDTIELLFFPRSHLDNASLLHTHVLSNARSFHSIDISDHTLMVYLSVGQLLIYHLRAEVHSIPGRKSGPTTQQQILATLGVGFANHNQPQPYSTATNAHETLGLDREIRMGMELAYVVDLCAPLKPMRIISASPDGCDDGCEELSSLQNMLSSPPLQCRLWLSSADSLDAYVDGPTACAVESHPPATGKLVEQVYSLPLFSPNLLSQGLQALHHATASKQSNRSNHPHATDDEANQTPATVLSCMMLTATGTLIAIDIGAAHRHEPISPTNITPNAQTNVRAWARIVAKDVEQFWLHEISAPDPTLATLQYLGLSNTDLSSSPSSSPLTYSSPLSRNRLRGLRLFSYGSRGLDVWFRLVHDRSSSLADILPPPFESTKLLEFDPEVYPLGFDSTIGVIVGITKGLRTKSMGRMATNAGGASVGSSAITSAATEENSSPLWGPVVCFRLQTKLQPYLHGVLMHLVANDSPATEGDTPPNSQFAYAYEIANSCRCHSYFPVSLELLLHSALNPSLRVGCGSFLGRVVSFLRLFPEFPDVVMNVARKNDSSCWPRLFEQAGTPTQLFQLCIDAGKLRMASCYLIVIQRTEGMSVAREHAKMVLAKIEEEENNQNVHNNRIATTATNESPVDSSVSASPPVLRSSPSTLFRRRRRLSSLASELERFIVLTIGMEAELSQRAAAAAEEERAEVERRRHATEPDGGPQLGTQRTIKRDTVQRTGITNEKESSKQRSNQQTTSHNTHPNTQQIPNSQTPDEDAGGCKIM